MMGRNVGRVNSVYGKVAQCVFINEPTEFTTQHFQLSLGSDVYNNEKKNI